MSQIKQFLADNMLRGQYITAEETDLTSPLAFLLWLAHQQDERNKRTNRDAVSEAVAEP